MKTQKTENLPKTVHVCSALIRHRLLRRSKPDEQSHIRSVLGVDIFSSYKSTQLSIPPG